MQTCAYLPALSDCGATTDGNKHVCLPQRGWETLDRALADDSQPRGQVRPGWRGGPAGAILPVIVAADPGGDRLIAMAWAGHTASPTGNPRHPRMHADPVMADLGPGGKGAVAGRLLFFEGTLDAFDGALSSRL